MAVTSAHEPPSSFSLGVGMNVRVSGLELRVEVRPDRTSGSQPQAPKHTSQKPDTLKPSNPQTLKP